MKASLFGLILALLSPFVAIMARADAEDDAAYIASQIISRAKYEAALQAQSPQILSAFESTFQDKGISVTDIAAFSELLMGEFIDEYVEHTRRDTAEIYKSMFSHQDLAKIAEFYGTPAGQALLARTTDINIQSSDLSRRAGIEAGRRAGPRVAQRLEIEGIIVGGDPDLTQKLIDVLR
ncbi:MAG: DUF2059 domain-containing protein [Paracoccaceae bacterium]